MQIIGIVIAIAIVVVVVKDKINIYMHQHKHKQRLNPNSFDIHNVMQRRRQQHLDINIIINLLFSHSLTHSRSLLLFAVPFLFFSLLSITITKYEF